MTNAHTDKSLPPTEVLEKEAAYWLAKIDKAYEADEAAIDLDDYAEKNGEFASWLSSSDTHRVALLRLLAVWRRTHRLGALKSSHTAGIYAPKSLWPRRIIAVGAIAAAVLVALPLNFFQPDKPTQPTSVHQTLFGQRDAVALVDGSRIELNSDTRLVSNISSDERVIVLEKGEAFFEVAKEEERPFKVVAGDQVITVLGTAFSVHRQGSEVEIIVSEGRVKVQGAGSGASAAVLLAGYIATSGRSTAPDIQEDMARVRRELGWRQGLVIFDKTPLEMAAAEFNRYNQVKLVIDDANLATMRFSGSFKNDNVDAFVRLLTEGFGVHVVREAGKILITG